MQITDFTSEYIGQAARITQELYNEACSRVPALPKDAVIPDFSGFVQNGLGVAALEDDKLIGFLCCYNPFDNAFGTTNVRGVFSPLHANGVIGTNRAKTYALMYQAAGEKWVRAGVASHAVCLYAHDHEAQKQFFNYGFGLRSVDAIRLMEEFEAPLCTGFTFVELCRKEYSKLISLGNGLDAHFGESPIFMKGPRKDPSDEEVLQNLLTKNPRYFATIKGDNVISYFKITDGGENFACDVPDMPNICGAYCLPEYRGMGIPQNLLNFMIRTLKTEGYKRLGVDFEGFNPAGSGFWSKHFTHYTHGVVRRIDEIAFS